MNTRQYQLPRYTPSCLASWIVGIASVCWAWSWISGAAVRAEVVIDMVHVGQPGNASDTRPGGRGEVNYGYRMGKYEVTNSQYVEFLNKVDPTGGNTLQLFDQQMGLNARGGIELHPSAPEGQRYIVKPSYDNRAVNYLTLFDAMRFINWLQNGQGTQTEFGAYELLGGKPTPSNARDLQRSPSARFFLPTHHEWYKAAFYDPVNGVYYEYPNGTDAEPVAEAPPGGTNSVNAANAVGSPKDVGAYLNSRSPYGTYDQGGNVWEWSDPVVSEGHVEQEAYGGSFWMPVDVIRTHVLVSTGLGTDVGFRVAAVPDPLNDLDDDRDVDTADLLTFIENWTGVGYSGPRKNWSQGDGDFDGDVDSADTLALLSQWTGAMATAASRPTGTEIRLGPDVAVIPEPATDTLIIWAIAAVAFLVDTRRL